MINDSPIVCLLCNCKVFSTEEANKQIVKRVWQLFKANLLCFRPLLRICAQNILLHICSILFWRWCSKTSKKFNFYVLTFLLSYVVQYASFVDGVNLAVPLRRSTTHDFLATVKWLKSALVQRRLWSNASFKSRVSCQETNVTRKIQIIQNLHIHLHWKANYNSRLARLLTVYTYL